MKVQENCFVKMNFRIRLQDGSIAEDSRNYKKLFAFQLGHGVFSDKFETNILGMSKNECKSIMLEPNDAFGEKHPAMIYQVPLDRFPEKIPTDIGMIISFSQPDGNELPGVILEKTATEASVDFNHPLSGQVVLFEVEIIDIASKEFQ